MQPGTPRFQSWEDVRAAFIKTGVARVDGRKKKLVAAAIAAVAIVSAVAIAATQFADHPQLTVFPKEALAGNPVTVSLNLPGPRVFSGSSFRLYSINYGDGNTTTRISSTHIYNKPEVYRITASFIWNGQREVSATNVYVYPSSFSLRQINFGAGASYRVQSGTLSTYNPYGIVSIPISRSGVNTTLTIDSVFLHLSGNSSFSTGSSTVSISDGLGVPHECYVVHSYINITGKGYVDGVAAGLPLNFTAVLEIGYSAQTFDGVKGNYTLLQDANTSIHLSLQTGGGLVNVGRNWKPMTDSYDSITGGMLWQNTMFSALEKNGSFSMSNRQMSDYTGGFTGSISLGLNGSYHGFHWSTGRFYPSLNSPMLELNVTSGSSLTELLTLDSNSPFPLLMNITSSAVSNGTTLRFSTDSMRISESNGTGPVSVAGTDGKEANRGNYTMWSAGNAVPAIGTENGILNITTAYDFALNNTSLGKYIRAAGNAEMMSADYNFTLSSWSMLFGSATQGGYAARIESANGSLTASGQTAIVNMSGTSARGTDLLTLASAVQILNSSSMSAYFFNSSGGQEMSTISISHASYILQTSPFLPFSPFSSDFAYTFRSMTGYTAAVDGINGQIMFFESGTSLPVL